MQKITDLIKTIAICASIYLFIFLILFSYLLLSGNQNVITETSFLNWDAAHYHFIMQNGYDDFRVAFFPLFPFFWKLLKLSPIGISLLNGLVFSISLSILICFLEIKRSRYFFLAMLFPPFIFMFLPYSEAMFFLSSALFLIGFHKQNITLILIGLFLCSLSRPVAYIFIPAIFITEYLVSKTLYGFIKNSLLFSLTIFLGLFLTICIHHYSTGNWLAFFEAQTSWGNYFRLPQFPITSWAGGNIVRLDGSALLIGLTAAALATNWFKKKILKGELTESRVLIFSTLYLAGISLFVLFFRGGWLFSLNRFVFATPFFLVFFLSFLPKINLTLKQLLFCFLALSIFWFWFESYVHIQNILKFEALTLFLLAFFLINNKNKTLSSISFGVCIVGNILLILYFYHRFLKGEWVG